MTEYWNKIEIGQKDTIQLTENISKMQEALKVKKVEYTLKQLSKSQHLRSMSMGFEIEYVENKIQTFFVYFRTKKMSSFKGILPFGINENWTLRSAVLYFGEPLTKSKHMVEIIYENLGLGMVFQGNWMRDQSLIEYCYFFQPSTQKVCSSCKNNVKQLFWQCQCMGVGYCSQSCKIKHLGLHRIICQKIDNE